MENAEGWHGEAVTEGVRPPTEGVPMLISYDAYRVFYTVARLGSFTKAAGALLSSQPNLTRTIRNLESALGCTLFVRSNRGAVLTPEGEKLFARVAVACEQIQAGEEELASDRSLQSGVVSIGASETALHGFLLPVLGAFHRAHPGIRLRIANHSTPQAFYALRNGLVDVAVVTSPGGHKRPAHRAARPIRGGTRLRPVADALVRPKLTLAELSAYPFISLGRETASYAFAYNLFAENGAAFSPDIEVATSDQILPLVRLDLGVAFLPEAFAAPALQRAKSDG
ncbi:MAG: LysR family transcriptional regulator [Christensenellales bacterium]